MEIYSNIIKLLPEFKGVLEACENKFREERSKLDVEKYFTVENLESFDEIAERIEVLETYKNQLKLERLFYEKFHEDMIKKVDDLFDSNKERERLDFWQTALPKINKNQDLRIGINTAKYNAVNALTSIYLLLIKNRSSIEISPQDILFGDSQLASEFESLVQIVDSNLELQYDLALQQKATNA